MAVDAVRPLRKSAWAGQTPRASPSKRQRLHVFPSACHTFLLLMVTWCCCSGSLSHGVGAVPVSKLETPPASAGAFATIFYDYGEDSESMLLAVRVLMRSIRDSHTKYRKLVLVPKDGLQPSSRALFLADDPSIEILRVDVPNVFKHTRVTNPRAQLMHMRNKLALWDDPVLSALTRIAYLDPENLVLRNLDEIFACTQFCAVDNGQSVVYSNSLLVVSPASIAARNLYSDAIDAFMISGREYDYTGIMQGFLPGLFQALEDSPLFIFDEEGDAVEMSEEDAAFEAEAAKSVVRRLPFYYSINHMVFYERLNWDLYKCKDKSKSSTHIPGPLLSYKYSGATIKPWFWVPYAYFEVFWHWLEMRNRLQEDHVGFFISKLVSQTVLFAVTWYAYVALCLKLRSEPNGRMRRLSSWGLPAPGNAQPMSLDIFNTHVVRKACQISCNILYAISSMPTLSSIAITLMLMQTSITMVPATMHPVYAALLWAALLDSLTLTVLIVYRIAHTLSNAQWKKEEIPSSLLLLLDALTEACRRIPVLVAVQSVLLCVVVRTDWFMNPVLRPTVLISLFVCVCGVLARILAREMIRVSRA